MGYDRDDTRHGSHRERDRWSNDRGRMGGRDERGFFERAGDELASWFSGDDDHDRERGRGERQGGEGRDRGFFGGRGRHEEGAHDRHRERDWMNAGEDDGREFLGGRQTRLEHEEQRHRGGFFPSGREAGGHRSERGRFGARDDRSYRPVTGDYGRGSRGFDQHEESGRGRRDDAPPPQRRPERPQSQWDQDDYRRTSFAGSSERSQHHDPHYQQWRERHMQELDRDYHDYHRERQSRFEDDFGGWRDRRQQKRSLLAQVREHQEVVGSDGEHVGTVDKVAGDRIILTRNDPAAGGHHHSIACTQVDRVEEGRVVLDTTAEQARNRWRDEDRGRALFERHDQGQDGPGILDRSFSGTYRD